MYTNLTVHVRTVLVNSFFYSRSNLLRCDRKPSASLSLQRVRVAEAGCDTVSRDQSSHSLPALSQQDVWLHLLSHRILPRLCSVHSSRTQPRRCSQLSPTNQPPNHPTSRVATVAADLVVMEAVTLADLNALVVESSVMSWQCAAKQMGP